MSYPWFIRNSSSGKHHLGPMEYQPITWQGFCITSIAFILTITLIFVVDSFVAEFLSSLLILLVGGVIIYSSYLLIAAHFSK